MIRTYSLIERVVKDPNDQDAVFMLIDRYMPLIDAKSRDMYGNVNEDLRSEIILQFAERIKTFKITGEYKKSSGGEDEGSREIKRELHKGERKG